MKPDWDDAPSWARYLTMDRDGSWHWHSAKPSLMMHGECWVSSSNLMKASDEGWSWLDSLEERPNDR